MKKSKLEENIQQQNITVEPLELDKWTKFYYFTFIVFKEQGDQENALTFLKLAGDSENELLPRYANQERDNGFKLKKEGAIEKAIEAFSRGADAGDPVSQYELAHLHRIKYEQLLSLAANRLFQAQTSLYRFYLEKQEYEKANHLLMPIMKFTQKMKLIIPGLPDVNKEFPVHFDENKEPKYGHKLDVTMNKIVKYKLKKPHDVFYDAAIKEGNVQERMHLYNLAALNGNAKSTVALYELNVQEQEGEARRYVKQILQDSKKSEPTASDKLNELVHKGDMITLSTMLEQFLLNIKDGYYASILETASKNGSPLIKCTLAQVYYGQYISEIGQLYTKGTEILRSKALRAAVEKLAEEGDILAQYHMGIIGKENREYSIAFKWFSKSATRHLPALHELGDLYERGIHSGIHSTSTDPEQAEVCYQKCAELGYARSQHALGLMAFHKKDFEQAMYWLEKSTAQGYTESIEYLKGVVKDGCGQEFDEWAAQAIIKLEKIQVQMIDQFKQEESEGKLAQETTTQEKMAPSNEVVQESVQHKQEEFKLEELEEAEKQKTSHDKQVLSLIETIYDNPKNISEVHFSTLLNHIGKKVAIEEMVASVSKMGVNPLSEAAKKTAPSFQEEARSQRTVALSRETVLDEKLVAQASFFAQEGVMFNTLREAANEGRVHVTGVEIAEGYQAESFWGFLPDFGNLLHNPLDLLQGFTHDHIDVNSYFA